ncbi:MAG: hypothetical protein RLZZ28_1856 [Bacteroidota bacterium]
MQLRIYYVLVLISFSLFRYPQPAQAQSSAYLFIQSESNLPFMLTCNGQQYLSTETGKLHIPSIATGKQQLAITSAEQLTVEYIFDLYLDANPKSLSLRMALDYSLQLYDMVEFNVVKGVGHPKSKAIVEEKKELVDRKELLATIEAVNEPVRKPVPELVAKPETIIPRAAQPPIIYSVRKIFDQTGKDGIDQIYVVTGNGKSDTIIVFLPQLAVPRGGIAEKQLAFRPELLLNGLKQNRGPGAGAAVHQRNHFIVSNPHQ